LEGDLVDDASSDGVIDEGSEGELDSSRAHFFSRTLGDGWVEVEPGIYLERGEFSELTPPPGREETLDDALSGALQPADPERDAENDEASGRLRRWLHR
jgi:hypothetical protein